MSLLNAVLDALGRVPALTHTLDELAHLAITVPDDTAIDAACGAVDGAMIDLADAVSLATATPPDTES